MLCYPLSALPLGLGSGSGAQTSPVLLPLLLPLQHTLVLSMAAMAAARPSGSCPSLFMMRGTDTLNQSMTCGSFFLACSTCYWVGDTLSAGSGVWSRQAGLTVLRAAASAV